MPSVAQESPTVRSSKKRRRDDNNHQTSFNAPRTFFADKGFDHGSLLQHHIPQLASRKIIPLASSKRRKTSADIVDLGAEGEPMQRSPPSSPSQQLRELQQTKHASREDPDERVRAAAAIATPISASAPLMRRCHICSRKPNKKSDLDSFADCQGCGQRTCYVCIRECLGWGPNIQTTEAGRLAPCPPTAKAAAISTSEQEDEPSLTMLDADADARAGEHPPPSPPTEARPMGGCQPGWTRGGGHRKVVCSRCCVEEGQDGDVVCLGCLPFVEG